MKTPKLQTATETGAHFTGPVDLLKAMGKRAYEEMLDGYDKRHENAQ